MESFYIARKLQENLGLSVKEDFSETEIVEIMRILDELYERLMRIENIVFMEKDEND